jgi:predicted kinase
MQRSTVYLLCGLPGSGKTTYADRLASQLGIVIISIDDALVRKYGVAGKDFPIEKYPDYKKVIMSEIKTTIAENIKNGKSMVLDFGVWKKKDREYFRNLVESNGAEMQLIYLKAKRALLLERLNRRAVIENGNKFLITSEMLDERIAIFEEPINENEKVIIQDKDN